MPYNRIEDLPQSVRDTLPPHAQEIYMRVYNSAWDNYEKASNFTGKDSREEIAAKVAWEAVEKKVEKAKKDFSNEE